MPFEIKKTKEGYKLYKLKEKKFVNKTFKTKQSAINTGKNYMRYRNETPIVVKNKILNKK